MEERLEKEIEERRGSQYCPSPGQVLGKERGVTEMRVPTVSKVRAISYPDPHNNRHYGERQVGGDLHTGGALQLGEVACSW